MGLYHALMTCTGTLTLPSFRKKYIYDKQKQKGGINIYYKLLELKLKNNEEKFMKCNKASLSAFIAGQTKLLNTVNMFLYMKYLFQQKHQCLTSSTGRIFIFTMTSKPALSPN